MPIGRTYSLTGVSAYTKRAKNKPKTTKNKNTKKSRTHKTQEKKQCLCTPLC